MALTKARENGGLAHLLEANHHQLHTLILLSAAKQSIEGETVTVLPLNKHSHNVPASLLPTLHYDNQVHTIHLRSYNGKFALASELTREVGSACRVVYQRPA